MSLSVPRERWKTWFMCLVSHLLWKLSQESHRVPGFKGKVAYMFIPPNERKDHYSQSLAKLKASFIFFQTGLFLYSRV